MNVSRFRWVPNALSILRIVLSTAGTLIGEGRLTVLQFLLLASRGLLVAVGSVSVWAESRTSSLEHLQPRALGKIATGFQFALLFVMFGEFAFVDVFLEVAIAASSLAAIDYLYAVLHRRFDLARN